jgi:hypothetical protein
VEPGHRSSVLRALMPAPDCNLSATMVDGRTRRKLQEIDDSQAQACRKIVTQRGRSVKEPI